MGMCPRVAVGPTMRSKESLEADAKFCPDQLNYIQPADPEVGEQTSVAGSS